jgi:hypothetical protein
MNISISCKNKEGYFKYTLCKDASNPSSCIEKDIKFSRLDDTEKEAFHVAVEFYLWYCHNKAGLDQDKLFCSDIEEGYYAYNYNYLKEYLSAFEKSGFVTKSFIERLSSSIFPPEEDLSENRFPIDEENYGFEGDIILNAQDPFCPDGQDEFQISTFYRYEKKIVIDFFLPTYRFELLQNNNTWYVDSIL